MADQARHMQGPPELCGLGPGGGRHQGSLCWELPWVTSSWEGSLLPILHATPASASPNSGSKSELLFNLP